MKDRLEPFITDRDRFFLGIALILPWIFLNQLTLKAIFLLLLFILTLLSGKKLKWGYYLIFTLSITLFHLFTPSGKLLLSLGRFPVTLGALEQGLMKSITLIGLIMISLGSVKPNLQFPGPLGGLLGKTLYYFEEIMKSKKTLKPGKIIERLDTTMLELNQYNSESTSEIKSKSTVPAILLGVLLNVFCICLVLISRFQLLK